MSDTAVLVCFLLQQPDLIRSSCIARICRPVPTLWFEQKIIVILISYIDAVGRQNCYKVKMNTQIRFRFRQGKLFIPTMMKFGFPIS